jgi:hypothetical protein
MWQFIHLRHSSLLIVGEYGSMLDKDKGSVSMEDIFLRARSSGRGSLRRFHRRNLYRIAYVGAICSHLESQSRK